MTQESGVLNLRDYQTKAIAMVDDAWSRGVKRPALVLPTGAGKTVVFGHIVARFHDRVGDGRQALVLIHTDELGNQAARKLKSIAPHLPVGIVKAGRDETYHPTVVASVQTLRSEARRRRLRDVGLIVVDECHHATAPTYRAILEHFGAFDDGSDVQVLGVTATLARSDNAVLAKIWQEALVPIDILGMIEEGYLLDPKGKRLEVPDLDLKAVRRVAGDLQASALGTAMVKSLAPEVVAKGYLEHSPEASGIAFWPTVEAAQVGAVAMNDLGIPTEVVHGAMALSDRRDVLRRADAGTTQVISNCMVLTEGFDWPKASTCVIARATESAPLYQQMVGRVLRPYEDQRQALILDVVGASLRHNLASLVDLVDRDIEVRDGESLREAVVREADEAGIELPPEMLYDGPTVAAAFDPLARASKRVWNETRGGNRFLTLGDRYLFLAPATAPDAEPGTWDVCWCALERQVGGEWGGFLHRSAQLGYAAHWAEQEAERLQQSGVVSHGRKTATWRTRPATANQRRLAASVGVRMPEALAGELSDAIDKALASPKIDTFVARILGLA